ncbi:histidinol-phosphatase, partial [Candidatus Termititenax persephonae]
RKKQIAVSLVGRLTRAQLFHASLSGNEIRGKAKKQILRAIDRTERQRGFGDFYQHVLVAQGSGEAAVDPYARPYDLAPLKIIVEEAGGIFTAFDGRPTIYAGNAVSSNGLVHETVLKLLNY